MTKQTEAMKLALEALTPFSTPNWAGAGVDKANEAITALRQALANEALDKKAENARELGLDYEPQRWAVFCQSCRKEWSVSYPHPGKDICADCDDKPAQQEPVAKDNSNYRLDQPGLDPLYTSPPAQRKPLTEAQINAFFEGMEPNNGFWLSFARAIEAAHGIKGDA